MESCDEDRNGHCSCEQRNGKSKSFTSSEGIGYMATCTCGDEIDYQTLIIVYVSYLDRYVGGVVQSTTWSWTAMEISNT